MSKIIIKLISALATGAVVTLTAGRSFSSPPAKIIVFVGISIVVFVVLSIKNKDHDNTK